MAVIEKMAEIWYNSTIKNKFKTGLKYGLILIGEFEMKVIILKWTYGRWENYSRQIYC